MNYKHTHERDAFYTLSQQGRLLLPKSIQDQIDPRNGRTIPKVRVTTDAKTGEPIAQIIKVRVADMDIFSPATLFDWRISVNLEMKIEGDFRRYVEPGDVGKGNADRSKDRLSYKHLQYQIDLTQVSPANVSPLCDLNHPCEGRGANPPNRQQARSKRNMNLRSRLRARRFGPKASFFVTARRVSMKSSSRALSIMSGSWRGTARNEQRNYHHWTRQQ